MNALDSKAYNLMFIIGSCFILFSWQVILYTNLVIIVSLALFLYIYFSISPFTAEEIVEMRQISLNKTRTEIFNKIEL